MDTNEIFVEARARIIWGDSPASVRDYVIANGIPAPEAEARIKEFNTERDVEIRKMGIRRVLIGAGLLLMAGIVLYAVISSYDKGSSVGHISSRGDGTAFGMALLAAFYGFWKLLNGICDLVRPKSEEGSVSDMED
ncbi:MAG TPA: hypothetical protein VFF11_09835 [Candidatus Binatia bacterium]|nr:hypothetical protein [Candidatus Binatia bacterium]